MAYCGPESYGSGHHQESIHPAVSAGYEHQHYPYELANYPEMPTTCENMPVYDTSMISPTGTENVAPGMAYGGLYRPDMGANPWLGYGAPGQPPFGLSLTHQNTLLQSNRGRGQQVGSNGKPKRRRVATIAQRRAANIRERRRMFNLNESFDSLRKKVPTFAYEKRLSRIETLRLAITYISFLADVVDGKDPDDVKLLSPKGSGWAAFKRMAAQAGGESPEEDVDMSDLDQSGSV